MLTAIPRGRDGGIKENPQEDECQLPTDYFSDLLGMFSSPERIINFYDTFIAENDWEINYFE